MPDGFDNITMWLTVSFQCSDTVGWATGRARCWWWPFDWSFARLTAAPIVTNTYIILSSNKMQTFWYWLIQVHLENGH